MVLGQAGPGRRWEGRWQAPAGSGDPRAHLLSDEARALRQPVLTRDRRRSAQPAGARGQPFLRARFPLVTPSADAVPCRWRLPAPARGAAAASPGRRCRGFVCVFHRHLFPIPSKLRIWNYEPPAALWASVARCLCCVPVASLSTVRTSVLRALLTRVLCGRLGRWLELNELVPRHPTEPRA